MTTLPPPPIMNSTLSTTQMSTPISQLPLKTVSQQDNADMDDPLIQGVLKEFEDEFTSKQSHNQMQHVSPVQHMQSIQNVPQQQQQIYEQSQTHNIYQVPSQLEYNKGNKKLIDLDIVRKVAIITIILFLLQYTNIVKTVINKLPESVLKYITGKELIITFLFIAIILYALYFLDILQ